MRIILNAHELEAAVSVGVRRHIENLYAQRSDTAWAKGSDKWRNHIEAACAELAAAKALRRPWEPKPFGARHVGDVGGYEIRWSTYPALRVNPSRDKLERPYVLVTGEAPSYEVQGWAYGHAVTEFGELRSPDPRRPSAYFLPTDQLSPLATLP